MQNVKSRVDVGLCKTNDVENNLVEDLCALGVLCDFALNKSQRNLVLEIALNHMLGSTLCASAFKKLTTPGSKHTIQTHTRKS